ncbi:trypsin-like serine peptidase [Swaminathania salitolerans]|uniref:Serine protease n=1 Tax=Swaminathania salitolerans TaxID=182838 RepID=A0A511BP04_9PROT|nr:trypsin-like peptidase domain-containing protein [Swaminathania salitolerans]GBQ16054.1 peptidase S1/S6 [Swaminathania salitolerans LMG 21291]GEL01583.1 hypothetical protein SSA02_07460 [Swaminathania salitolerans]
MLLVPLSRGWAAQSFSPSLSRASLSPDVPDNSSALQEDGGADAVMDAADIAGRRKRHAVALDRAPWRILGRVQTELGGRCTGFLVAPSVIMTAAHCLWLPRTGHYVQPASVHFMLGYDTGAWRGTARAIRFVIAPGYDPDHPLRTSQADRATIVLDRRLADRKELVPFARARTGDAAMLAGYQQDRRELAIGDLDCRVTGVRGGLVDHDCKATHGASGAPLMIRQGEEWKIGGIDVTAMAQGSGGTAVALTPDSAGGTMSDPVPQQDARGRPGSR